MLEDAAIDKLISEIYCRLCLMPEEWEYEFDGPHKATLLQVSGGAKSSQFTLMPIVLHENSRQ
jgi:hypothetical protein